MGNKFSSLRELIIRGEELRKENENQTFALVNIKPSYYVDGNATIAGILVNGAGEKLPVNMYLSPLIEYLNNNSLPLETIVDENIPESLNENDRISNPLTTITDEQNNDNSNKEIMESKEDKLARLDQEASNGLMGQNPDENQTAMVPSIEELHALVKPSVDISFDNSSDSAREAEFNEDMSKASNMNSDERNKQIEQRATEYDSYGYQESNDEDEEINGD